jgi:hypothetical protein
MKSLKVIAFFLVALLVPKFAAAESWLTLDASEYPPQVKDILNGVRHQCQEDGQSASEDPQAGVMIVDLNHDGSKDIVLDAWRACQSEIKGSNACNTAGCDLKIFKQVGRQYWNMVLDETVDPTWFLSASKEGYFHLLAVSVSRKVSRCPDPSGNNCDFLVYWKRGNFLWSRIR